MRSAFVFLVVVVVAGAVRGVEATAPQDGVSGRLESARLRAVWEGDAARVRVDYRLRGGGLETARVPFTVLELGGGRVTGLAARAAGVPLDVVWGEGRGQRRSGTIRLPGSGPVQAGDGAMDIVVTYTVRGALGRSGRAVVPVVAVAWPPAEALPGTFRAEVRPPKGLEAYDVFPAGLRADPGEEGGDVYRTELPVLPSILAFSTTAERPWLTLALALDTGVVLVLLVLGWAGVRYLRRRATEGDA